MAAKTAPDSERLRKQAFQWFVRLQAENCGDDERSRFCAWLARSEAHRSAYAEAVRMWGTLDGIKHMSVPGLSEARAARPPSRSGPIASLIFFLAALAGAGGWWLEVREQPAVYATGIGERRSVVLADGTRIELNALTRLTARESLLRREVRLEGGEALFDVVHDRLRPFTVQVAGLNIRDLGTRFDVHTRPDGVAVEVLEGEVALDDGRRVLKERVAAGSSRVYREGAGLGPRQPADADRTTAWLEGRLVFRQTPLAEVAAEMERHHAVKFEFAAPALARETLSGSFDAADLDPFLKALEKILPIRAERTDSRILLRHARGKAR